MSVFPRDIKDRAIEFPSRYKQTLVAGTTDTFDLVPVKGIVVEEGTAVNKAYLQPIEESISGLASYQSPTGVVGQLVSITTGHDNARCFIEIGTTVTGGAITISRNGATAKPLLNVDGTIVDELSADTKYFEVIEGTVNFTLRPSGGGNTTWLQQYDGTNATLQDEKAKDVAVKVGEYVYNEFYPTKIVSDNLVTDTFVKSLLHLDGADGSTVITDEKSKVWTANGNAQIDTAESKFGGASLKIGSVNDWIDTPSSVDFNLGGNDFTIDLWIKPITIGVNQVVFGRVNSTFSVAPIASELNSSNQVSLSLKDSSGGGKLVRTTSGVSSSAWSHIAMVRNGNTLSIYFNGIEEDSIDVSSFVVADSTSKFAIGKLGEYTFAVSYNGWLDEFRFVNGEAKWVANFTPPIIEHDGLFFDNQTIPPVTSATSATDLLVTIAGPLQMASPVVDQVYTGFKSKVNLWDAGMEGQSGESIKSIQRGVFDMISKTTQTISITPVKKSSSIVKRSRHSNNSTGVYVAIKIYLNDSTGTSDDYDQVIIERNTATAVSIPVSYTIIEYNGVKSIQYGQQLITDTGSPVSANLTLSTVDMSKTIVEASQKNNRSGGNSIAETYRLTSTTNLFLAIWEGNADFYYYVIEFN